MLLCTAGVHDNRPGWIYSHVQNVVFHFISVDRFLDSSTIVLCICYAVQAVLCWAILKNAYIIYIALLCNDDQN